MRLSCTLIIAGLWSCGTKPPSAPELVEPVVVDGMVEVPEGTVQMGPRHVLAAPPSPPEPGPSSADTDPAPYTSRAGMGLAPRFFSVRGFWIDRTEVTRADYARFLEATGYRPPHVAEAWAEDGWNWTGTTPPPGTEDHPVVLLSWYDAKAYCIWAGKRLPSEAEWQLAALGPASEVRRFPWGTDYDARKLNHGRAEPPNFDDSDGYERTSPVGAYPGGQSPYGLLDAFGNAWEYTADRRIDTWDGLYIGGESPPRYPGIYGLPLRVAVRGGSFYFDLTEPAGEWAAFSPEVRRKSAGVRCARDAGAQ